MDIFGRQVKVIMPKSCIVLILLFVSFRFDISAQDRRLQRVQTPQEEKHALIIGNNAYPGAYLQNAVNDALTISKSFEELGFEVDTVLNTELSVFDSKINAFIDRLEAGDVALFYYAGHGVQVKGQNFLIPVDFQVSDPIQLRYRAIPADMIRERMEQAATRLNILVLDACRDNPFRGSRSVGTGLAQMNTGTGTFLAFATAPGRTAADNPSGENGLFTYYLIQALEIPGLSLDEIFNQVRRKVYEDSAQQQLPWTASSVIGDFYFRPSSIQISHEKATGRLRVTVSHGAATIYLNGERITTSKEPETVSLNEVPIGNYKVRVEKNPYRDIVRSVRIEDGKTAHVEAWFEAGRSTSNQEDLKASPDLFCQSLEQVLTTCTERFHDIVVSPTSETRAFLTTTIAFPGAWYNKVYRKDQERYEFLSNFESDLAIHPEEFFHNIVTRIRACIRADQIVDEKVRSNRHRFDSTNGQGICVVDIALAGSSIDLQISAQTEAPE